MKGKMAEKKKMQEKIKIAKGGKAMSGKMAESTKQTMKETIVRPSEIFAIFTLIAITLVSLYGSAQGYYYSLVTIILYVFLAFVSFIILASGFLKMDYVLSHALLLFFTIATLSSINIYIIEDNRSLVIFTLLVVSVGGLLQSIMELKQEETKASKAAAKEKSKATVFYGAKKRKAKNARAKARAKVPEKSVKKRA